MAATIDTLKHAKRFREAKTDEERAEAFADGLREVYESRVGDAVTKAELALAVERLERRIDGVEARFEAKIDELGARLDAKIDGVEARLDALGKDLTIRLGLMLAAAVTIVGGLVAIF